MNKYIRLLSKPLAGLLALFLSLLFPLSVLAIAQPTSTPQVNAVYVYNNVFETGDTGVFIDYYIDYTPLPPTGEVVTESFLAAFVDTDGVTQLAASAPYTYQGSGYGYGVVWVYFSAAEVTAHSITSTNIALYRVWLVGNPTLVWAGTGIPPKTIATIDSWSTVSAPASLLALRVLATADALELAWGLDLISATPLGTRLTALGEAYFLNVIPGLRTMAPNAFSSTTLDPTLGGQDYTTSFGAVASGAIVNGTPVTLVPGANTVNLTGAGTFTMELNVGTVGSAAGAIVNPNPTALVAGTNTVTVTGAGASTITVALVNTQSVLSANIAPGSGFDMTALGALFGMSRTTASGFAWFALSIVICAGLYAKTRTGDNPNPVSGKIVMLLFSALMLGGAVMGLVSLLVVVVLVLACAALITYVIFLKDASF